MQRSFTYLKNTLAVLFAACLLFGCTKGGDLMSTDGDVYLVSGDASSSQLVPVGANPGTATFTGWYDVGLQVFSITLAYTNLWTGGLDEITAVKFYGPASAGANGTLVRTINFSAKGSVGTGTANVGIGTMSSQETSDVIAGKWYYIICTKNSPNGVVRGQLSATKR